MKKLLISLTILAVLVLLVGCDGEELSVAESPFEGGDEGLTAEFEPMGIVENGVYTIFDNEEFPIEIVLKNKGEEAVAANNAEVTLYGILLSDFTGISSPTIANTGTIEAVSDLNPDGGEVIIDFTPGTGDARYTQALPGTFYDVNVFANFVYLYKTHLSIPNVCFKEDLRDKRICDVEERKNIFVSGAPIQVTDVEEKSAGPGIVALEIEIENAGGGQATTPNGEFDTRYDQVIYTITPASEIANWKCTSSGRENEARLVDDKATIRCKLVNALEDDALYTKAIGLEISYDYRDIIQETIRIEKVE